MIDLLGNPTFLADFEALEKVGLNPSRHTAPNAKAHSLAVVNRVEELAALNGCSVEERSILRGLGYAHDIGKILGGARPEKSVEVLGRYGVDSPSFAELVRFHDINLPWFNAFLRGEPPSDKAWRRLADRVDLRLLCLFMIADRVDAPGGWTANQPLVWFLGEVRRRLLVTGEIVAE